MGSDVDAILKLEVPVVVRLGERQLPVREILALVPGSIIELSKAADAELDLLINNKQIGTGNAVKIAENFGLEVTFIGDVRERVEALTGAPATAPSVEPSGEEPGDEPVADEQAEAA